MYDVTVEVYAADGQALRDVSISLTSDVIERQAIALNHGVAKRVRCTDYELVVNEERKKGLAVYRSGLFVAGPVLQRVMIGRDPLSHVDLSHSPSYEIVGQVLSPTWRSRDLVVRVVTLADTMNANMREVRVSNGEFQLGGISPGMYGVLLLDGFRILEAQSIKMTWDPAPVRVTFGRR